MKNNEPEAFLSAKSTRSKGDKTTPGVSSRFNVVIQFGRITPDSSTSVKKMISAGLSRIMAGHILATDAGKSTKRK